jgi:hypothetical protein
MLFACFSFLLLMRGKRSRASNLTESTHAAAMFFLFIQLFFLPKRRLVDAVEPVDQVHNPHQYMSPRSLDVCPRDCKCPSSVQLLRVLAGSYFHNTLLLLSLTSISDAYLSRRRHLSLADISSSLHRSPYSRGNLFLDHEHQGRREDTSRQLWSQSLIQSCHTLGLPNFVKQGHDRILLATVVWAAVGIVVVGTLAGSIIRRR